MRRRKKSTRNDHAAYPKTSPTLAKGSAKGVTPSCHRDLGLTRMISSHRSTSLETSPEKRKAKEKALPFVKTKTSTKMKPHCLRELDKKRLQAHGSPPPMGEINT
jgi:hypothetical protein